MPTDAPATPGLVICDMDGTLLDDDHRLPEGFGAMLERVHAAGAAFVPASGRQYATLRRMFDGFDVADFIAENGAVTAVAGEPSALTALPRDVVDDVVDAVRAANLDLGLVMCCAATAHVERDDEAFLREVGVYYVSNTVAGDLHAVADDVVKLAVYDFGDAERGAYPLLREVVGDRLQVALSGAHWVDMMDPDVDKGTAVAALRERFGVGRDRTVVFGDYLNDLPMMRAGDLSYAMANAHPDIKAAANHEAPANTDAGVLTVLDRLFP
ncbi:Cof-type HAD-IIB family hydrolase [Corynebacterium sp.]|uniref:Cof-type HAD-IIB family hydrolase n=1 Tax=Corynebacterium sp. TaxID=1720 RepID=UPI0026DC01BC|nr:Cof-type HAD-IIB family hydrolase [Corynebacterium sp.]MDO4610653.1 Cof-type HAD-IIB family hydrolase [Corynebacterium sp.]